MLPAERRIRQLKLSGPGPAELHQARALVEEAFRTATLPGFPPNALVVVRRLDLGALSLDLPQARLADRISALVRNMGAGAVCVDERSGSAADAVWFSDPLRPYQALLLKLLDGDPPHEWYWTSLFPGRGIQRGTVCLEWLLLTSRLTPLQGLAPAHLLQAALEPRRWAKLLSLVTPSLAKRMLSQAGVPPAAAASPPSQEGRLHRRDGGPIPSPALSPEWRRALELAVETWGEGDVRGIWLAWQALVLHQPAWLERSGTLERIKLTEWLQDQAHNQDVPGEQESPLGPEVMTWGTDGAPFSEPGRQGDEAAHPEAEEAMPIRSGFHPEPSRQPIEVGADWRHDAHMHHTRQGLSAQDHPGPKPQGQSFLRFSPCAGFALVIPVLERIAVDELLNHNQQLIELDFPHRLLAAMAQRVAVPGNDPVRCLLAPHEPGSRIRVDMVHLPGSWRRLTTASGRPLQRGPGRSLPDLITTTQLIAGLYLRRFCRLSLRGLIQRPGRVVMTPTHWDALFDINQVDLRLRRVALDSDPGWVPWLGRVVQFHYQSQG